ncbi:MAG: OmpH family outer membrane protein [Mucilaginibacter sp.]
MKKLLIAGLLLLGVVLATNRASAQTKVGYINMGQLVQQLPETKTLQDQINAYSKQFLDQLTAMNTDFQAKVKDYEAHKSAMTDAARTAREAELSDLQKRLQEYSNNSQQQVEAKSNELAKPLFDKVKAAVTQVAREKGYAYVINSSAAQGDLLLVSPTGDDLTTDVKTKLGIK